MIYDIYSKLARRNGRNYLVLALWGLMLSIFILKKVLGWHLSTLGYVYPTYLLFMISELLVEVLEYFVLLRLLKIRVTFAQVHNRIAVIIIARTILSGLISMLFYHYEIVWRAIGTIVGVIAVFCIVYVVDKIYAMTRKQKITFIVLSLILDITGRILVAVVK